MAEEAGRTIMLCKLHVLIVGDDDEVTQPILNQLMDAFGVRVHLECASALTIARESLADTDFDAILLDSSLANQKSSSTLATLQSLAPNTPLFLLTDSEHPPNEIASAGLGNGGCLLKQELQHGTWLKPLYAAMANRPAVRRSENARHSVASANNR
jgi:DNA-binding NarL/FixJ family response regulator